MTNDKSFKPTIPASQRQQLYSAILSLIGVLLGIVLTIAGQAASHYLVTEPTAPEPIVAPVYDEIEELGTTHFDDLAVTADVSIGDALTVAGIATVPVGTEHIGLPSVISTDVTFGATTGATGAVATIADGEIWIVHDVFVNVTTNFDATGDDATLIVGDGNDADGFVVLADANLQAADTEATGYAAGWQGLIAATQGAYIDEAAGANSFIYAPSGAAETIDYLVSETTGDTLSAGAATIYVVYTRIQ